MKYPAITPRGRLTIRILIYWMAFVGIYMTGGFISSFFPGNSHFPGLGNWVSGTMAAFFATWLFLNSEKSSFRSIGLFWQKGTLLRFCKGFLLGTGIFFVMVLILSVCGGGHWQRIPLKVDGYTMMALLTFLPLGLMEEVAFRSYSLIRLNQVYGLRVTLLIIALAFALYHVSMGWNIFVAFEGPFVWSFVFGLAAVWSRGIALPAGIHISANILQNMAGLHGNNGMLWKMIVPENHGARMEVVSVSLQLGLLAITIIAMEFFIRRIKNKSPDQPVIATGKTDK